MSYQETMRIVRGSQRYVGSQDKDLLIPYSLENTTRNIIEGDRNLVLNLQDQYFREREASYIYRLYGKIRPLVQNVISGCTYDPTFMSNNLYYDPIPLSDGDSVACGYPSTDFFRFLTYTGLTSAHMYSELESSRENWYICQSYVYNHNSQVPMTYYYDNEIVGSEKGVSFVSGDGIPFHVKNVKIQGKSALQLVCPVDHGLNMGEHIILQNSVTVSSVNTNLITTINNSNELPIFSLGDQTYDSEKKLINIILNGQSQVFNDGDVGVFVRLIDPQNRNETTSQYYVHEHKVITSPENYELDNCAFESGLYSKKFKSFQANNSPPYGVSHTVIKEDNNSYLWNFNNDLDVSDYNDNLGRPLSELYLSIFSVNETFLWKTRTGGNCAGLGWSWNFKPDGKVDPYPNTFTEGNLRTPYNLPQSGDTFTGAFVEYNQWELEEIILSEIYHKLTFNDVETNGTIFFDPGTDFSTFSEVKGGYKYQPHHRIPILEKSNTISVNKNYQLVPEYATYSNYEELWRWRDNLPIGFFETQINGVEYPFVNGAHYPYTTIDFKITPIVIDKDYVTQPIIQLPTIDDCE